MAFAQQHRRPNHSNSQAPLPSSDSEDSYAILHPRGYTKSAAVQRRLSIGLATTSDSDTDWHVINANRATLQRTGNAAISSPQWTPSESESVSARAYADSESMVSDIDTQTDTTTGRQQFSFLPAHDGTGTFADIGGFVSDSSMGSISTASGLPSRKKLAAPPKAQTTDFLPVTASMPNILLPDGGIAPPSFTGRIPHHHAQNPMPEFVPTMASRSWREFRLQSSSEEEGSLSENDAVWRKRRLRSSSPTDEHDQSESTTTNMSSDEINAAKLKRNKDLDSIPTHHPSLPGSATSAAIIHSVWRNLRRLTTHIIENDTTTSETFGTLVSEATLEGCLPFGSHLHMDFNTGSSSNSKDFSLNNSAMEHVGRRFTH
ncbi:hypothetical protein INT44_006270 [Umbelopsis vinacea]|uniref:Uncharacterized protein n=1 Tax=Umbelopsis vinacea TaxID=44442 RepID=A0A8H7UHL9_9FUNG|nr:hypothetical protein INT44_006270 [Umbelopsis vinacea]